jgi:hypothetical protein
MGKFLHIFSIYISLIMCLLILDIVEGLYDVNILIAILCFQKKKKGFVWYCAYLRIVLWCKC